MVNDNLKQQVSQGLSAMRAGSDVAAKATDEINNDARSPELKAALEEGNRTSRQWAERIEGARRQAGDGSAQDNPIMQAHYEVSRRIRQHAQDDTSRDLGIIANGQMALHYWVAAFGTMASYTRQLGMDAVAREMKLSADEARHGDDRLSGIAEQLLVQG